MSKDTRKYQYYYESFGKHVGNGRLSFADDS